MSFIHPLCLNIIEYKLKATYSSTLSTENSTTNKTGEDLCPQRTVTVTKRHGHRYAKCMGRHGGHRNVKLGRKGSMCADNGRRL